MNWLLQAIYSFAKILSMNCYGAYAIVAGVSALGSTLIAFGVVKTLSQITDSGMWAIAAMAFAPALMAMGVCYFISASHRASSTRSEERRRRDDDPFDSGAFIAKDR